VQNQVYLSGESVRLLIRIKEAAGILPGPGAALTARRPVV